MKMKPIQKQILFTTIMLIIGFLFIQYIDSNEAEILSAIDSNYLKITFVINVVYTIALTFCVWGITIIESCNNDISHKTFYEFIIDYVKLIVYFGIVVNVLHFIIYLLILLYHYGVMYSISFVILIISVIVFMVKRK